MEQDVAVQAVPATAAVAVQAGADKVWVAPSMHAVTQQC
jgi:hypothetical protein